ncbi:ADP-ribosyl-[dinitrogen reductase] hydrolase [Paenibacillus cellulosilyticus]|uniref:ADP-ribosyl-[dinitrogen reductase] hydrolase n=1 Tax=Paenibacillus cellulosilyticus TaxID=375489 RepID=A0A2V2Z0N9_9BACL|nr:ADP-ribosylglycohydrolase family protein [Paenibacillus cellulosilyticus]PWW08695.1 ADP-ribosyl-[dinitrogen reductase] hydrolase [Paenibacillus cellulosilyticus]QKS48261.1 ADP-ribosylglycohydrolase family protein [Paenibacillus cellulosilyticus]
MKSLSLHDRIRGGLYGVAVGDALGGTTEFMSRMSVQKKHGYLTEIVGGGVWELEPGEVTDDTMMTLCVADGIVKQPDAPVAAIGEHFLTWYRSNPKDIGNIIRSVLSGYDGNWTEASFVAHMNLGQSAGNGALMRCLPVALAYAELNDVERLSRQQAKMTHYDERCAATCEMYNRIAHRMLEEGAELRAAIADEIKGTEYVELLQPGAQPNCGPTGFVVDTMRWVLHLLLTSNSFEEVVQRAANEGGDSDTIGAIAGGLAGVYYGFSGIPQRYAEQILIKDRLDSLSEQLYALRVGKL